MGMIRSAQLFVFDDSPLSPIMPGAPIEMTENVAEYCLSLYRKIETSELSKQTELEEESDVVEPAAMLVRDYTHANVTGLMTRLIERARRAEMLLQGFDMLVFLFEDAQELAVCVCYLPYRSAQVHAVSSGDAGLACSLVKNRYVLPGAASKFFAGAIMDCGTMKLRVKDALVETASGKQKLFEEVLFGCRRALSQVEAIEAIKEIACEVAGEEAASKRQEAVHKAIADSIEQSGTVDVRFIADQVYADDGERCERFHEQIYQSGVEPVIEIESNRLKNAFERVKLSTDNGITITMSRKIAEDQQSFRVVNHPDGSISIELLNIQSLRTI